MKKILIFLLTAVMLLLTACSAPYADEATIRASLQELLEPSFELMEIYFGEGLSMDGDSEAIREMYANLDSDVKVANYHPVAEDAPYQSIDEIKEATLRVFSDSYAELLFQRAFTGISASETVIAAYARFIEEDGVLKVRVDLNEDALELGRVYDLDSMKITRSTKEYTAVEISTTLNGESATVRLTLVETEDGWRLDSPTY